MFRLFRVASGHSYQEMEAFRDRLNELAQAGLDLPATTDGLEHVISQGPPGRDAGSLKVTVTTGTYGLYCVHGNAETQVVWGVDLIGPIEFE